MKISVIKATTQKFQPHSHGQGNVYIKHGQIYA